jgi:hypothetical protein
MPNNKRLGPEGARRRLGSEGEGDVEGHTRRRLDEIKLTAPADEPGTSPETIRARKAVDGEDDVEGHNFGHNAMLSRSAATSREREVQRNLRQHDLKNEARRPFLKKG